MNKFPYFKAARPCLDGSPAPGLLRHSVERAVRFEEADGMGVVWHGRYASYFEDARVAFCEKYGIGYSVLIARRMPAPVRQMHFDFIAPLHFGESCTITAQLHWSEAARMNFSYAIHNSAKALLTTGYTVQLFMSPEGEVLLEQPDFYAAFCAKWKNGDFGAPCADTGLSQAGFS